MISLSVQLVNKKLHQLVNKKLFQDVIAGLQVRTVVVTDALHVITVGIFLLYENSSHLQIISSFLVLP